MMGRILTGKGEVPRGGYKDLRSKVAHLFAYPGVSADPECWPYM